MDLIDGIKNILDGNAVIIMGAGASCGAKNPFGDFPSGSYLAKELYNKCHIIPDDIKNLQDAAQCYEDEFSATALISEIRSQLNCTSFTDSHETIYTLPWMRYYTTNYDDVALLAAKKHNIDLTPVTLTTKLDHATDKEHLCIHINGYIGNLNESTLHHEFKLTANSYLSQTNILNSEWGDYLIHDLETAKCIVILGLSLQYDLQLSQIIFNASFKNKTIIIDQQRLTQNSENQLKRFGTVYKIGVDGFAEKIKEIKESYKPKFQSPTDKLYTAFTYEHYHKYGTHLPTPDDVFRLFLNGNYNDSLFYKKNSVYSGFVYRTVFEQIRKAVTDGKQFIFIHSDMGNGKTACINELRFSLSRENYHIFSLCNADSTIISEEISAIYSLSKESKVIVIIDDYTNYMEILQKFSLLYNGKVQFILTARSALNYNKMPIILDEFDVKEGKSAIFNVNNLNSNDIKNCVKIFDQYGLFGKQAKLSEAEKIRYLSDRKGGSKKFQSIMLEVIQSDLIKEKIISIVKSIKETSSQYYDVVLLCLLTKVMNLRLSTLDIERISQINLTTDPLFKSNPAINELFIFDGKGELKIKSPVTARFILQKVSSPKSIISSLFSLALFAEKYSNSPKHSNILISIISYSHINSFLREFDNSEQFLLEYYDELSKIEYYKVNNFFWLQYAISCIETHRFDRAKHYLDTAYGLIPEGFVPFQINNQQARFYLERISAGESPNPLEDFKLAHKLLMIPITSPKDDEYNVIRLFGYYSRKKIYNAMQAPDKINIFKDACKDAYARTQTFIKKSPFFEKEFSDLQNKLLSLYLNLGN